MISGRNAFGKNYIAFTELDPGGNSYQPGAKEEMLIIPQMKTQRQPRLSPDCADYLM
jgi:hypothetical protein